jgi:hypothetical protein
MGSTSSSAQWSSLGVAGICLAVGVAAFWGGRSSASAFAGALGFKQPVSSSHAAPPAIAALSGTSTEAAPAAENWETRWQKLAGENSTPARDRALAAMVEHLAKTDPKRALELAGQQGNWDLREQLRNAAMRGWGSVAPDAAVDWALTNRLDIRMQCVAAALTGAAENPAEAVRVALRACKADPGPAADYGHALISALVDKPAAFEEAVKFASAVGTDRQQFLLDSAYYQWAKHQPEQALAALGKIGDPKVRASAYDGLLSGWAAANAQQLTEYAQKLPPGEDRTRALAAALPKWVERDPASATEWLGRHDPSPEFDDGIAAVATRPSLMTDKPESSMEWASNITDRARRLTTKNQIFTHWAERNFSAAERYAKTVKNADDREMMLEVISGMRASR